MTYAQVLALLDPIVQGYGPRVWFFLTSLWLFNTVWDTSHRIRDAYRGRRPQKSDVKIG